MNNANEINQIVLSNPMGEEFALEKVTDEKLRTKKKYKEVFLPELSMIMGNISQTALQVANQGMTLQIAEKAPNGLFTATTNAANLSKFSNGTTSTMVRDTSGHLVKHAGFTELGLRISVNPAIVLSAGMQIMSVVSGTHYLHEINNRITEMDAKLEELIEFHHDANIGRLLAARKGLTAIANREFVDKTDLDSIRNFKKTADEIHEEYVYRLERQKDKLNKETNFKKENKKLEEINSTIIIAFEANKLSLYAELIEIGTRMKIGSQVEVVKGLTRQLKQNYYESFYHNIDLVVEEIYSERKQRSDNELSDKQNKGTNSLVKLFNSRGKEIELVINGGVLVKSIAESIYVKRKITVENKNLTAVKINLKENKEHYGIDNIINEVVELPYKETEILYIPTENDKQRVFVPIEYK